MSGATIKSSYDYSYTATIGRGRSDDEASIALTSPGRNHMQAWFPRGEVLAALRAVDAIVAQRAEDSARMARAGEDVLERKLADVTDANHGLAETLSRMQGAANELRNLLASSNGGAAGFAYEKALDLVEAALEPKPIFVLPTEVPARIEAYNEDGEKVEMCLWTDGHHLAWHNMSTEVDLFPDTVMAKFSDHRLIESEAW